MTPPQLWDGVLRRLGEQLPAFTLRDWLGPLVPVANGEGLTLVCPSPFHRDRVRERYLAAIRAALVAEAGAELPVGLEVGGRGAAVAPEPPPLAPTIAAARPDAPGPPAPPLRIAAPVLEREPLQQSFSYRFENFVVGPGNALAREAALAIARGSQPGVRTLYLAARTGLGKTHLARALAEEARRCGFERSLCTSAEGFTSEFLAAIQSKRMAGFKHRYREQCRLLVVEDVQFLRGKKATQLELFHTVAHLLDTGGRVVVTADREPRDLEDLDDRLRSQIAGGLVAVIEPPDARVRREILRQKAAAGGVRLPEECLDRLVDGVRGSVRDLEGVLVQLVATASLLKRPIDRSLTETALRKLAGAPRSRCVLDPGRVVGVVAGYFETTPAALASRSRRRDVLVPRQLAMYLCRRYTEASLQQIGEALGRDHPAVSHAIRTVERQMLENVPLRYQVEALVERLDGIVSQEG
jgi:chromosomal replication initiator protein